MHWSYIQNKPLFYKSSNTTTTLSHGWRSHQTFSATIRVTRGVQQQTDTVLYCTITSNHRRTLW